MSAALCTVTLNPAIDQTITLKQLRPGQVHRATAVRYDAGGKGVNVAGCLADWGLRVVATGLLGADNAAPFESLFAAKRIDDRFIRRPGKTRTNIKLLDGQGTTDINLPGLRVGPESLAEVRDLLRAFEPNGLIILSGSLPEGLPQDAYADLAADLRAAGARVLLDASGPALAHVLDGPAGRLPYAVKPNRHELEAWTGRALRDPRDLLAAACDLHGRGLEMVVVSLGAEGALFVSSEGALHAAPPVAESGSTVGAGDAMVAGLAAALRAQADLDVTARLATAFAVGKLHRPGPNLPDETVIRHLAGMTLLTPADEWALGRMPRPSPANSHQAG